ncbi:Skt5p KNAG_0B02390 [Huiozyma naganishii CBS 8797]|uniref:Protein SKT5 n=1 Tax=Huiozyma naganishii (strain ATCC MYA-139 / BCRC 22969 / CBS 8797 / KCTC 17520 / NBRC 10181 / NCYC 3082 / Yp74L-3) TaxID=1071383 RepID=J7S4N1_HUIN7|nr:hypothetical protein KNAG_0B02390 [Kazachstania naganishii CBS 8797]CCK68681.1 hypothetical protein KNAG_0B02390 [Kazachstania naganishii CBS 8797]
MVLPCDAKHLPHILILIVKAVKRSTSGYEVWGGDSAGSVHPFWSLPFALILILVPMHPYRAGLGASKSEPYVVRGGNEAEDDDSGAPEFLSDVNGAEFDDLEPSAYKFPRERTIVSLQSSNLSSAAVPEGKTSFSSEDIAGGLRGRTSHEQSPDAGPQERPYLESQSSGSAAQLSRNRRDRTKTKSVDLSHLYLCNNSCDTQLTSTNEAVADISHQLITQYLGEANTSSLVPRLKTIEMYRENVKKSKDPMILFEFAQYMLQTALTMGSFDTDDEKNSEEAGLKKQFLKEAQHYLKKLSLKGYSDAQYLLADVYASGVLGKVNHKESFKLFQAAAKHGHIESAYRTSHCYEEGIGTIRDARKALNFLKFAASRNHPSAMFKLGLYSFYGRMGLSEDVMTKQNGIKWLSRAAARANDLTNAAPFELAKIYEAGFIDIVIPDQKYAMELYIQAATLGNVDSMTILGQTYETGNSVVPQDVGLSIHYYTQAALKGDPVAMLGLCAWYLLGAEPVLEKDIFEAFQWAQKAAIIGYPKAQFTLGYFYENGKGCEPDSGMSRKWYEKAAMNNYERAKDKLNSLRFAENPDTASGDQENTTIKKHNKNRFSVTTLNLFGKNKFETLEDNSNYETGESQNTHAAFEDSAGYDTSHESPHHSRSSINHMSSGAEDSLGSDEPDSVVERPMDASNTGGSVPQVSQSSPKLADKDDYIIGAATGTSVTNAPGPSRAPTNSFKFSSSADPPDYLKQRKVKTKRKDGPAKAGGKTKKNCVIM